MDKWQSGKKETALKKRRENIREKEVGVGKKKNDREEEGINGRVIEKRLSNFESCEK